MNQKQEFKYDGVDNLVKRFDALGNLVMSLKYDPLNNPTEITDALQNTSTFKYDALNRLTQTVDPKNRVTQFSYDDLNRLVKNVDALQGISTQSFDSDGNRDSLTDPNKNQTQFTFDLSGRLIQETLATGDKVKYTYSARDLLESVTNGRNQQRQFEYDAAGRLTHWTDQDGTVSYTYDGNGNVLTVTDTNGTITREYDPLNRITKYTDQQGNTLQYEYDPVGNLITLIYPDGKPVHYEYNSANQLITVIDWAGRETHYGYDPNARLISTELSNGTKMTRIYDEAGQLTQQKDVVVATGEIISQFDFKYDAAGNIIEEKTNFEPDPEINLEMTYQAANRLATYNDKIVQFDADGNLTKGPLSGEWVDFTFDSRNRLIQAGSTVYRYNAENQRIGVNQTNYVVNSQPALSQVLVKTEADGTQTFYVYGLGLIGQETNGEYTNYHFDLRGSTVALTDETAQVIERFQYSPYGLLLGGDASKTPFLFNGMYGVMTDGNGLYYMRARLYSPEIRRFVNQDILLGSVADGQTLNRYAYVTGQPISLIDPFGLSEEGVEKPGFWEGLIPIWGSGKAALYDFQNGQWGWGIVNSGFAISDVFLVKAIAMAVIKGFCKGAAKAGAGGNWLVIDEVIDPSVVKQANPSMCGPACGEMVLRDRGLDVLQQLLGKGLTNEKSLARALSNASGLVWEGGYVGNEVFQALNQTGSWIAMMWEPMRKVGHWVVVDGIDDVGRVIIRDPADGTRYQMALEDFFEYWTEIAVFQR